MVAISGDLRLVILPRCRRYFLYYIAFVVITKICLSQFVCIRAVCSSGGGGAGDGAISIGNNIASNFCQFPRGFVIIVLCHLAGNNFSRYFSLFDYGLSYI